MADDLSELASTDMFQDIPPEALKQALSSPPFVSVPGVFNVRDLGQSASGAPAGTTASTYIRPGLVFRAGTLSRIDESGKALLRSRLGVRRVVDLRSSGERSVMPAPEIPGVGISWTPPAREAAAIDLERFVAEAGGGENGYAEVYLDMLEVFVPPYRSALEHIRDRPEEPLLFHCLAGKDRTGVLAALILLLAGAPDEFVARDYALTRLGLERDKATLTAFVKKWRPNWSEDTPGMREFSNSRASYMLAFLQRMRAKYGDVEGYARDKLGFVDSDIERIKANLKPQQQQQQQQQPQTVPPPPSADAVQV